MSKNLLADWMARTSTKQTDFAEAIQMSQEQVSRYCNGKCAPGRKAALAIERATGGEVPASSWDDLDDDAESAA